MPCRLPVVPVLTSRQPERLHREWLMNFSGGVTIAA